MLAHFSDSYSPSMPPFCSFSDVCSAAKQGVIPAGGGRSNIVKYRVGHRWTSIQVVILSFCFAVLASF